MLKKITSLLEMMPAVAFIIAFSLKDLIYGTKVLIICSLISFILILILNKKVTWSQAVSVTLVVLLGGITLISKDTRFIKMKPTILYSTISLVLTCGLLCNKLFIKKVLENLFVMDDGKWRKLTAAWVLFFLGYAGLNELVWRNFSEQTWVMFKVFGIIPISLCFVIGQVFILRDYLKK